MEGASAQNMSGNATDLTNAGSMLAAELQGNTSRTNLTVSNVTAEIGLELVAENFTSPLAITAPDDGTGRLFVVDQIGVVQVVDANGTTLPEPFLDLRDRMVDLNPTYDERGLLSIAFHPNFSENGKVYAFYSAPLRPEAPEDWNCTNHISEFQVDPEDQNRVNMTSEKVLMYIDKPYHNHNGGQLAFTPRRRLPLHLASGMLEGQTTSGMATPPVSGTPRTSRRSTARCSGSTWRMSPTGT